MRKSVKPVREVKQMAARNRICPVCGNKAAPDAKFCMKCGTRFEEEKIKQEVRMCPSCGAEVKDDAKFCLKCGASLVSKKKEKRPLKTAVPSTPKPSVIPAGIAAGKRIAAMDSAGEMDLGDAGGFSAGISSDMNLSGSAAEKTGKVYSPISGLLHCLGSYARGLFTMPAKPKVLLFSLMMAGIWTVLAMLKNSGSEAVEFLSWLTFAEGGLNREGAGVIGGILGKGCTAVLLSTLFSGGFANTAKGIGSLFRNEGKGSLIGTLLGIITGASACLCFMGIDTASASSSMAGISGALLCLQAIGRKDGNLYQLAESLTSRKISGLRSARPGKAKSLLSGISMGFILMTAIAAIGV